MDSSDEDSVMSANEFDKMKSAVWKNGYSDGAEKGREQKLQADFDEGYQLAFQKSYKIGQIQGIIEAWKVINPDCCDKVKPITEALQKIQDDIWIPSEVPTDEKFNSNNDIQPLLKQLKTLIPTLSAHINSIITPMST